jgi:hypothetical protein
MGCFELHGFSDQIHRNSQSPFSTITVFFTAFELRGADVRFFHAQKEKEKILIFFMDDAFLCHTWESFKIT